MMVVILQNTFTVIFILQFIIGNLGNGFIALVNCMNWLKRKKMSLVDRILTALAISRICLLWVLFLDWWMSVIYPAILMTPCMLRMISVTWVLTSHFNIWLATSLGIFYFLKIAIFSNSLFLYLKWRCEKVIYMALLVSLAPLFANTILICIRIDVLIEGLKGNTSYNSSGRNFIQYSKLLLFPNFMFILAPFAVSLIAFLLLIFSLWKHHNKIQRSGQGGRDAKTTAHVKALQSVVVFLLLYISFFLSLAAQVWTFGIERSLIILYGKAVLTVFPSGHSCVLILGNNKLRQALILVLQGLRHRLKDVEPSGL